MTTKDHKDGKLITFSKAFDTRAKILYTFSFFVYFIGATFFLRMLLTNENPPLGAIIVTVLGTIACYIAAYRYGNKALMSEKLFVNKNTLQLITQGMFSSSVRIYQVSDISNFRHLKKPEISDHTLAGQSFDYLGFQTEQKVINEMLGDNRLSFDWKGIEVTFGQDIYSWDFEELEILLSEITGNNLRDSKELERPASH